MQNFIDRHFNALLLSSLLVFFSLLSLWMLKHGDPSHGFEWASAAVGNIVGALLLLLKGQSDPKPPASA